MNVTINHATLREAAHTLKGVTCTHRSPLNLSTYYRAFLSICFVSHNDNDEDDDNVSMTTKALPFLSANFRMKFAYIIGNNVSPPVTCTHSPDTLARRLKLFPVIRREIVLLL